MVRLAGLEPALRDVRSVFDYPFADSRTGEGAGTQTRIARVEAACPVQLDDSLKNGGTGWI